MFWDGIFSGNVGENLLPHGESVGLNNDGGSDDNNDYITIRKSRDCVYGKWWYLVLRMMIMELKSCTELKETKWYALFHTSEL